MSYRFVTGPDSRCIAVVWDGVITLETMRAFYGDLAAQPGFSERDGLLHDLRGADIQVDFGDLDAIRQSHQQVMSEDDPARRLALIVDSPGQFGRSRQGVTKVGVAAHVLVTYSEAEARAFVGLPDDVVLGPEA